MMTTPQEPGELRSPDPGEGGVDNPDTEHPDVTPSGGDEPITIDAPDEREPDNVDGHEHPHEVHHDPHPGERRVGDAPDGAADPRAHSSYSTQWSGMT